ncbi:MAG: hypothetical protein ACR2FM_01705 [Candidatus Saccharimonadales bacterium]
MSKFLYRNVRAHDLFDAFLVSSITSLLLVRFYLYLTGYPQIGTGSLHIAHMLYGGLLMMVAIVISLGFLGIRARHISAIVGGIGFGVFIDELGKFITEDNNYFFRPTVGIIYAFFVILYLSFNFLSRTQRLTSREYQLNALVELEEAIAHDFDRSERAHIYTLLNASDKNSAITRHLRELVDQLKITAQIKPSRVRVFIRKVDDAYLHFWRLRPSHGLVRLLFILEIVALVSGITYTLYNNIGDIDAFLNGSLSYGRELIVGQVIASVFAAGFTLYGLSLLKSSRAEAFEQLRRATLINIYLTQVFIFIRIQFDALPGLVLNLLLLLLITFVLRQERRLKGSDAVSNR